MWDSFQTSTLIQKNLSFIVFETLAMCVGSCLCAYASNLRTQVEDFLGLYIPKIDLFAHKNVIFSILTFLKSILNLIELKTNLGL